MRFEASTPSAREASVSTVDPEPQAAAVSAPDRTRVALSKLSVIA
jgi:hypothetical protein